MDTHEPLKEILLRLYEVQYSLTQTQFRELFGSTAMHMWSKFVNVHSRSLLEFFANLDGDKKEIMCQHISKYLKHHE